MKISGHLYIQWLDEFLNWNPEKDGGLEILALKQNDIWRPDVALHKSFRTFTGLGSSHLLLTVDANGSVLWRPYQVSTTADTVKGEEAMVIFKMKLKRKSIF
ncbi:hypothetical protein DPMN_194947 [Dreissena polymorpha]|uniref:Neurotransmitter-gated ion-channel ligand-binding domain-containing protein n=1 Tax=Dreissena polymorpha TaxID=45954 RepID=A0A9D3Y2T7_DREPO|nr:hypothetical protein DPMN_194947 [Dreissena polymorpha]